MARTMGEDGEDDEDDRDDEDDDDDGDEDDEGDGTVLSTLVMMAILQQPPELPSLRIAWTGVRGDIPNYSVKTREG